MNLEGIGVFPLSHSRIEKMKNLSWGDGAYVAATNPNWEWQKQIDDEPVCVWFPKFFNLPREMELGVLETKYAVSSVIKYEVDPPDAAAGVKLKIKKPWEIEFKDKPDWLDSFAVGGTTRFSYDREIHRSLFLIIFLSNKKVDLRFLTKANLAMLDDFPIRIRGKIEEMFNSDTETCQFFVRKNAGIAFEWV